MAKKSTKEQTNPPTEPVVQSASAGQGMGIEQAVATAYSHWNAGQVNQAELLCQKVLVVWPAHSDALHLLGLMSHNWGNLDLAIDYLRKACESPRAPATYCSNLAEMCRQKGLLSEGEIAARRAVTMDPMLVGGWNNLGIILQEEGKLVEALACLQRVVSLKPDYAEAYNNLGNTYKKLGQLDKAQPCYMRALELSPEYPEAHSNLSNLLKEWGQLDRALEEARRAIEINPRLSDAYINAAAVEIARLRHDDAMRWLNALLTFAPTNPLALAAKVGVLNKLDLNDEALVVAHQAVMSAPESGDAYDALGKSLQALGRNDEALAAFEKAIGLKSTTPEQGYLSKGMLLMEINRTDEARAAYASALEVNPRSATAYFNSADLKTFKKDDPEIARMEKLLAPNEIQSFNDRMALHFTLAKAWLDTGDAERGFAALNEGNRLKRSTLSYDATNTRKWVDTIAKAFPAEFFKSHAGSGVDSTMPLFIIGMPRSGTTLIEQILAAHPKVHGAGELSAMRRIVAGLRTPDGQFMPYPEGVSSITAGMIKQVGELYVTQIKKISQSCEHIVDKMPANFVYAGLISLAMPQARIIHCRRDPVDTCLSCYTKLFTAEQNFSYDLKELGQFYNAYHEIMKHWRQMLPADRFIEVDYEAVVDDLETEARRLVQFCGLQWNDACLEFYRGNRTVRTASVNQVRQPIYKRSVGRWKKYAFYLKPLLQELGLDGAEAKTALAE
jgi:tetratricopeptide (TPR) repeat protein